MRTKLAPRSAPASASASIAWRRRSAPSASAGPGGTTGISRPSRARAPASIWQPTVVVCSIAVGWSASGASASMPIAFQISAGHESGVRTATPSDGAAAIAGATTTSSTSASAKARRARVASDSSSTEAEATTSANGSSMPASSSRRARRRATRSLPSAPSKTVNRGTSRPRRGRCGRMDTIELAVGAVALDERLVELPAEAGPAGQRHHAVDEGRAVLDHAPPDRIAIGVEHLEVGAVRLAREQVRGDVRLLVVRELDRVGVRDRGVAAPVRRTARPRGVEVADVERPDLHQVAAALGRVLALAGADGDTAGEAHVAHVAAVVRPAAGLLEPADVQVPDAVAEIERHARRVALVRVDRDHEVVARDLAHDLRALGVLRRRPRSELELAAAEPHLAPRL